MHKNIQLLERATSNTVRVLDPQIPISQYSAVDLSVAKVNGKTFDTASPIAWQAYLDDVLKQMNATVAYGGYLEKRSLYDHSPHFMRGSEQEKRNIHLGIDLWHQAGTSVHAVLDGVIHSYKDNAQVADYGPTIILQHSIDAMTFYTLYGHLSVASLQNKQVGERVKQGQEIARLGTPAVNGNYAPHLHFQIIMDMEDYYGDYPGASSNQHLDYYQANCPDPNLLLKLDN